MNSHFNKLMALQIPKLQEDSNVQVNALERANNSASYFENKASIQVFEHSTVQLHILKSTVDATLARFLTSGRLEGTLT